MCYIVGLKNVSMKLFCYADRSDGNKWRICKGFYNTTESRIRCVTLADYLIIKIQQ